MSESPNRHVCYQCKRPLPPDYRGKPWNIGSFDHYPMFDSQPCRDAAIGRYLHRAFDFTNLTNYVDDGEGIRGFKEPYDQFAEAEALRDLADEYRRFERRDRPDDRGKGSVPTRLTPNQLSLP
jgi:hypothetical protein